jgi:hypothetical protein
MTRAHCPRCHQDIISFTPVELCPFCGAPLTLDAWAPDEPSEPNAAAVPAWNGSAEPSSGEEADENDVVQPSPFGTTLDFPDGLSARGELWAVEGGQAVVLELTTQGRPLEGRAFHFVVFDEEGREMLSRAIEFDELVEWHDDEGRQGYRYLLFHASDEFAARLGGWTLVCDWDG